MVVDEVADMLLHMVVNEVADMLLHMAAAMVADMTADNFFISFLAENFFLANMDLDMVADKEVDKVADMVSGHG